MQRRTDLAAVAQGALLGLEEALLQGSVESKRFAAGGGVAGGRALVRSHRRARPKPARGGIVALVAARGIVHPADGVLGIGDVDSQVAGLPLARGIGPELEQRSVGRGGRLAGKGAVGVGADGAGGAGGGAPDALVDVHLAAGALVPAGAAA